MSAETHLSFPCFGGTASVHVRGDGSVETAARARERLLDAHRRLSRFDPDSELSRLNRDCRREVPATPLLRSLAAAVWAAGQSSGGLVDATLVDAIERAGYAEDFDDLRGLSLAEALASRTERAPGVPAEPGLWREIVVDDAGGTVTRPPGVRIDGGGIAKGLLADLLATDLTGQRAFAIDCCGDVRVGGQAGLRRRVLVDNPFGGEPLHEFGLRDGAAATSGIGRRCWLGPDGRAAHHILDPRGGEPAFTGIVQATALAPTALLAEVHAKAALLAGPAAAPARLPHGGVLVGDDGGVEVIASGPEQRLASAA